eukprot:6798398-Prymnesium_polylepis.1
MRRIASSSRGGSRSICGRRASAHRPREVAWRRNRRLPHRGRQREVHWLLLRGRQADVPHGGARAEEEEGPGGRRSHRRCGGEEGAG